MEQKLKDIISMLYYSHDLGRCNKQQEILLEKCTGELEKLPELECELNKEKQWNYFVMQIALENVSNKTSV